MPKIKEGTYVRYTKKSATIVDDTPAGSAFSNDTEPAKFITKGMVGKVVKCTSWYNSTIEWFNGAESFLHRTEHENFEVILQVSEIVIDEVYQPYLKDEIERLRNEGFALLELKVYQQDGELCLFAWLER